MNKNFYIFSFFSCYAVFADLTKGTDFNKSSFDVYMEGIVQKKNSYEPDEIEDRKLYIANPFSAFSEFKGVNLERNQGIKFHIGGSEESAERIFKIALPILQEECVFHKVVTDSRRLKRINDDPIQKGKLITAYTETDEEARRIAFKIDEALSKLNLGDNDRVVAPHDKLIPNGKSGVITYRYGAFKPGPLTVIDQNGMSVLTSTGEKQFVHDVRDEGYKPEFMHWNTAMSLPILEEEELKKSLPMEDSPENTQTLNIARLSILAQPTELVLEKDNHEGGPLKSSWHQVDPRSVLARFMADEMGRGVIERFNAELAENKKIDEIIDEEFVMIEKTQDQSNANALSASQEEQNTSYLSGVIKRFTSWW